MHQFHQSTIKLEHIGLMNAEIDENITEKIIFVCLGDISQFYLFNEKVNYFISLGSAKLWAKSK